LNVGIAYRSEDWYKGGTNSSGRERSFPADVKTPDGTRVNGILRDEGMEGCGELNGADEGRTKETHCLL